ncbi:pyocin activator PrtN family protein [Vibrio sp. TRT 2004]|uniref:pyocin activator PrtN family protein n=1 Tax=Vibrio sp. TRT 2004 TaxID=3418506 RepID=UPI003CEB0337
MNTKYALHARFGTPIVALGDICEEFFHINAETANGKANSQSLPIPTFRMEDHKRSPFMVHLDDLADLIDLRIRAAKHEFTIQGKLSDEEMQIVQKWQWLHQNQRQVRRNKRKKRLKEVKKELGKEAMNDAAPFSKRDEL